MEDIMEDINKSSDKNDLRLDIEDFYTALYFTISVTINDPKCLVNKLITEKIIDRKENGDFDETIHEILKIINIRSLKQKETFLCIVLSDKTNGTLREEVKDLILKAKSGEKNKNLLLEQSSSFKHSDEFKEVLEIILKDTEIEVSKTNGKFPQEAELESEKIKKISVSENSPGQSSSDKSKLLPEESSTKALSHNQIPEKERCSINSKMTCFGVFIILAIFVSVGSIIVKSLDPEHTMNFNTHLPPPTSSENITSSTSPSTPILNNSSTAKPFDISINNSPPSSSPKPITKSWKPSSRTNRNTSTEAIPNSTNYKINIPLDILKGVFEPPTGQIFPLDNIKETKYFQKFLCDDKPFKTLSFRFVDAYDEIDFSDGICSNKVTGLELSGQISVRNLYNLLKTYHQISYLSFAEKQICESLEEDLSTESNFDLEKIYLNNLIYLRFSDFPECEGLYRFNNLYIQARHVKTFVMDDTFVSFMDVDPLRKIMTSFSNLENFSLRGTICSNCKLFDVNDFYPKLTVLNFVLSEDVGNTGVREFTTLLQTTNMLQYINSNVVIPSRNNLRLFYRHPYLRLLNVTFNLHDELIMFSVAFFSHFSKLEESHLKLLFNNTSVCRSQNKVVKLTSLKKGVGNSNIKKLTLSSNCKIDAVKGWSLRCRDFFIEMDPSTSMRTIFIFQCPKCTKIGCSR